MAATSDRRMDPEIKKLWTEALRSGKYAQGSGYLKQRSLTGEVRHCCLGVLCEVARANGLAVDETSKPRASLIAYLFGGNSGLLPASVVRWAGLSSGNPRVYFQSLTVMNDRGTPFGDIADAIDRDL